MEEGLLTLMFILFMVAASIMDAVGRRKKKQQRMEEMEAEEVQGEERPGFPSGQRRRSPGSEVGQETGVRGGAGTATSAGGAGGGGSRSSGPGEKERDQESAETLVPEDLWAILTGQPPQGSGRQEPTRQGGRSGSGSSEPETATQRSSSASQDPGPDPRIPVPVPQDRMSTRSGSSSGTVSGKGAEAPTRRSSRWMEGTRGRGESERWSSGGAIQEEEASVYDTQDEPWGRMEDIAAEDLTEADEGEIQAATGPGQPVGTGQRGRRQISADGRYTRLLASGNVEDLRKAIVLREVLGPPVAFRDEIGPER